MIYTTEVQRLYNIDGDEIGVSMFVAQREDNGDMVDILEEDEFFLDGFIDEDVEDRDFVEEDEYGSFDGAYDAFKWHRGSWQNFLD